jgi:hypothetical protein
LNRVAQAGSTVLARAAARGLDALVEAVLPLDQASHAHRLLEDRAPLGKIVLSPGPIMS